MSIAGGLHLALERGRELGCGAVQIFLKNQRQWAAKPLTSDETRTFTAARRATAIRHVFAHSSYLINLGNPDEISIRRLAELVLELVGSGSSIVKMPLPKDDPRRRQPDVSLARSILGWLPKVPLKEGLERTIAYFRTVVS